MEPKQVVVQGVLDPSKVVLFGYWIPLDENRPDVAVHDEYAAVIAPRLEELEG